MSQSRKFRGYRSQKVVAEWFAARGWPWPADEMGPTVLERLSARISITPDGCWEYDGARVNGYGRMFIGVKSAGTGRIERTHRLTWMLAHGPIPSDQVVCHRCDNRACCNPECLFLGTQAENMADMDSKGRRVNTPHPGEANGRAVLTEADVRLIRSSDERGVDLAARLGVTKSTISSIRNGRLWKSVA